MKWVVGILVVGVLAYYIWSSTSSATQSPAPSSNTAGNNPQIVNSPAPWYSPAATQAAQSTAASSQGSPATASDGTPVMASIGVLPTVLVGPRALSIPSSQIFNTGSTRPNNVYQAAQLGPVTPAKA